MTSINVSVQFDGILPKPVWMHSFHIEHEDGRRDFLISVSETPTIAEGWRIVQYVGQINVAGYSDASPSDQPTTQPNK